MYEIKSSNSCAVLFSLIRIFLQYIHPNTIPNTYAREYHRTSRENKLNATGSKLLINISIIE